MKKILSLLLVLAMILSLCACGGGKTPEETIKGKWECTDVEGFSMKFNKNGSGTFYMDEKSADITWDYVDSQTYEHQETGEEVTIYSYHLNWDDATYTMVTEAGGKKELMLSMDGYDILFTKK